MTHSLVHRCLPMGALQGVGDGHCPFCLLLEGLGISRAGPHRPTSGLSLPLAECRFPLRDNGFGETQRPR